MPSDPTLYLYTSLTAGSSHIITATSRIETILKANKIPFKAVDCATDEKARMLWSRRSKGKKIPGLVKFNDVIADLEQVEEWNEYGELEDQIEDQVDIFGDVPISATSAEAQAAATARAQGQSGGSSQARTASETRHISISDPKDEKDRERKGSNPANTLEKKDSPLSMAMRQAGNEAAAKAGQKSTSAGESARAASTSKDSDPTDTAMPAPTATTQPKLDMDTEEISKVETGAKMPAQLAAEGAKKTSVDKIDSASEDSSEGASPSSKSNEEQILDHRRQSSIPQSRSSLAKTTSIDDSHTVASSDDKDKSEPSRPAMKTHRGSSLDASDPKAIRQAEKAATIEEGSDEDDAGEEEEKGQPVKKAAKVSATDQGEENVLQRSKPQEQMAADASKAGESVGD